MLPCEEGNRKHKFLVQKIGFLPNFSETLVALNFLYKNSTERLSTRRHALMKRSALWDTFASPLSYRPHMLPLKSGHRMAVISDRSAGNIENRSMLCYVITMSCHVMSCHVMFMSCHVMSCHVMLCYGRFQTADPITFPCFSDFFFHAPNVFKYGQCKVFRQVHIFWIAVSRFKIQHKSVDWPVMD